jgi:hypothetical protein
LALIRNRPANQIIAADFNCDGNIDLAVTNNGTVGSDPGGIVVLFGNGDGTFKGAQTFPAGSNPLSLASPPPRLSALAR